MAGKTGRQQQNQKNQPAADSMPPAPAVAPFLLKTHQMVEDPATDYVISWTPTGASFVVSNIEELARKILPTHFKHNNFSSFVRQLNTYGFRKVSSERWEFTNDHFLRAEPDLLTKIVRRKPSATPKTQAQPNATDGGGLSPPVSTSKDEDQSSSSTTSLTPIPPQDQYLPHDQQQVLLQDNEKLKRENQILSAQLEDARRMCQMYQGFLERHINVSKLNANSSQVVAPNIVEKVEETHEEEQVKRGASTEFKLFGVCLKEFAQETNNNNKRKRFCNQDIDSIIERPPKMAGFWAL